MPVVRPVCRDRIQTQGRIAAYVGRTQSSYANVTQVCKVLCRTAVVARKSTLQKKEIHGAAASAAECFGFAEISFASVLILAGTPPRVLGLLPLDC
jgi:hypothetical protein